MNRRLLFYLVAALPVISGANEKSEGEASPFPPGMSNHGNPVEADVRWTAYYITPVEKAEPGEGEEVTFTDIEGKKIQYSITGDSAKRAEMEAVAVAIDKEGKKRYVYQAEKGEWIELPVGSMGMGNRVNPLVPLVHVAADQSEFPYGSLVHVPMAEGYEFTAGQKMSGYFWVGDVGSLIKGNHMDLFVGEEEVFSSFVDHVENPHKETKIYKLPKLDEEYNPGLQSGLSKILHEAGFLDREEEVPVEEIEAALLEFQKSQPLIPESEYGQARAATTLWFLTQAVVGAPEK
ncbi:MAG: 3D domain-containing protein [Verrucomicrobiales bacterium]|nr:3D domain-containing protein [Verrucomicrobiales bacterium]